MASRPMPADTFCWSRPGSTEKISPGAAKWNCPAWYGSPRANTVKRQDLHPGFRDPPIELGVIIGRKPVFGNDMRELQLREITDLPARSHAMHHDIVVL